MPSLTWIGKDAVLNHHLDVPYRVLEKKYDFGDGEPGNKIIHGDNLEALKSLLPEYEGRVKCIYIDPPYNTGNENWVYNDNVNSPKIKKWLGQVVGKESEDLTRHDKWLCMMYPRLKLLQKLLSNDGAIFISIDDNEQANLKLVCDEIFGAGNFVTNFLWKSTPGSNTGKDVKTVTEYILMYKGKSFKANTKIQEDTSKYNLEDEFVERRGKYVLNKLDRRMTGSHYSEALNYQIEMPDKSLLYPGSSVEKQTHWNWRWSKTKVEWGIKNDFIVFKKNKGLWSVYFKQYQFVNNDDEIIERTLPYQNLLEGDSFNSARGTSDLMKIFESKKFDYPKPVSLIEEILKIATSPNAHTSKGRSPDLIPHTPDIILDSFAGSGTTAHAVLNLNKQDGGNRKFILVEMEDYAETITAERVRRVIKGYGPSTGSGTVTEGTGGSFAYYELGPELLKDGFINEDVSEQTIREYLYYTETNHALPQSNNGYPAHLGNFEGVAYYVLYNKDETPTLDATFLASISEKADRYVIYADNCIMPQKFLFNHDITFKKIPRDIRRF